MKQRQMVFAALVSIFLLAAGASLALLVGQADAGWKLFFSGCLLAALCVVQGALSGNNRKFVATTQDSRGHGHGH